MAIRFHVDGPWDLPGRASLLSLARTVAKTEKLKETVAVVFCDDPWVRQLNKTHRGLDKVTDVLSFHYGESDLLGEVYVAIPQTQRQAPRWKNSFENELRRVVVHGLLHLAGFDHMTASDRKVMRQREDSYLKPRNSPKKP